jgi:hypothetical protein
VASDLLLGHPSANGRSAAHLDVFVYSQSSQYATLLNARFLTFAVSTIALWLAARFLAPARDSAVAYIAGHAILLFGLSLEIGDG